MTEAVSKKERLALFVLAAIQFTIVVDFLIIMPLGPQYMRVLAIAPGEFGLIVSAYAISAGMSGVAAGFFLDRFDRKPALLWLYFGFTLGTLLCALAPGYLSLIGARMAAGAFGGVVGALILTIIGDIIPPERRGAAMGLVMSSFSVASICGVPIGLFLAAHLNWHAPFFILAALSAVILGAAARIMPSLRDHLEQARSERSAARALAVLMEPNHQIAFVFMAVLVIAGFCIFPFLSAYMVANVGVTEKQLPLIYLSGGLVTLFSMNWIGRWADRVGKLRAFTLMSLSTTIPILALTNLPRAPLIAAIGVSTLFMVCMSGRYVPAMVLMTASVEARHRGGFMSMNSSVQQFASGLAAYGSGQVIGRSPSGAMTHFSIVGIFSVTCVVICMYLARFLKVPAGREGIGEPVIMEG